MVGRSLYLSWTPTLIHYCDDYATLFSFNRAFVIAAAVISGLKREYCS